MFSLLFFLAGGIFIKAKTVRYHKAKMLLPSNLGSKHYKGGHFIANLFRPARPSLRSRQTDYIHVLRTMER